MVIKLTSDKVSPCPLCKRDDFLSVGTKSADGSQHVRCLRCHLGIDRELPKFWPIKTPKTLRGTKLIRWLEARSLKIVVRTWNRLPRSS